MIDEPELLARAKRRPDAVVPSYTSSAGASAVPGRMVRGPLGGLHGAFPRLHLKALDGRRDGLAGRSGRAVRDAVLEDIMAAGLGSLPGGGAEIFAAAVRRQICRTRPTLDLAGRPSHGPPPGPEFQLPRCSTATSNRRPIALITCLLLRHLQDETGGFQALVPLVFHPQNTALRALPRPRRWRSPRDGRQPLDARQFPARQGLLGFAGRGRAQSAPGHGPTTSTAPCATSGSITTPGPNRPQVLDVDAVAALIRETGREPVERDSLYRRVVRNGRDWEVVPTVPLSPHGKACSITMEDLHDSPRGCPHLRRALMAKSLIRSWAALPLLVLAAAVSAAAPGRSRESFSPTRQKEKEFCGHKAVLYRHDCLKQWGPEETGQQMFWVIKPKVPQDEKNPRPGRRSSTCTSRVRRRGGPPMKYPIASATSMPAGRSSSAWSPTRQPVPPRPRTVGGATIPSRPIPRRTSSG